MIELKSVTKVYSQKTVLQNITLTFNDGKLHALLGENGSGKSTMAKILCGDISADSGKILLNQKEVNFSSAKDSLNKGIVLVHQTPLLASELTVEENILLSSSAFSRNFLSGTKTSLQKQRPALLELKQKIAPDLNLGMYIKNCGGDLRFFTALLGALLLNPDFLILDEPGALLDFQQRKNLFSFLKQFCAEGKTVLFITHSTSEALNFADTISILKDGIVSEKFSSSSDYRDFLSAGNAFSVQQDSEIITDDNNKVPSLNDCTENKKNDKKCLSIKNAECRPKKMPSLLNADIEVNYGEITIVSGMQESAAGTLELLVTGLADCNAKGFIDYTDSHGESYSFNLSVKKFSAQFLRRHKIAVVYTDRNFISSDPFLTILQLLTVYCTGKKNGELKDIALDLIKKADVAITPEQKVSELSGGMLQRLILEREMSLDPDLIILSQPLQGLDAAAQQKLCRRIVELKKTGKAILILGSDDFPLSICSKIYKLDSGVTKLIASREDA